MAIWSGNISRVHSTIFGTGITQTLYLECAVTMTSNLICFLLSLTLLVIVVPSTGENTRPIIGVFTQPTDGSITNYGEQYIAASYVKYVESAGARVAPIKYVHSTPKICRHGLWCCVQFNSSGIHYLHKKYKAYSVA